MDSFKAQSIIGLVFVLGALSSCSQKTASEGGKDSFIGQIEHEIDKEIDRISLEKLTGPDVKYFRKSSPEFWKDAEKKYDLRGAKRMALAAQTEIRYKNEFLPFIKSVVENKANPSESAILDKTKTILDDGRLTVRKGLFKQNSFGRDLAAAHFAFELSKFESVEYLEHSASELKFLADQEALEKAATSSESKNLDIQVNSTVRIGGKLKDGQRVQESLAVNFRFVNCKTACEIETEFLHKETSTLSKQPAFVESTQKSGAGSIQTYARLEALRRGGYALAVEDFNNDGNLDMFVGQWGEAELLMGDAHGEFKKAEGILPEGLTLAKAAAFVDLDGNGLKDLVVTRFSGSKRSGDIRILKNIDGKKFVQVDNAIESSELRTWAMPLAVSDFTEDGATDFYVGFPGERDFSILGDFDISKDFEVNGLFENKGNHKFTDASKKAQIATRSNIFPHGALASDITGNGKQDLIVVDDRDHLSPIYKNLGHGRFAQSEEELNVKNYGYGMGVETGDLNNDGNYEVLFTNVTFSSSERVRSLTNELNLNFNRPHAGMRIFYPDSNYRFHEATNTKGIDVGEGAAGLALIDYDGDGLLDIYVTNGLWTGSDPEANIDSEFAISQLFNLTRLNSLMDGQDENKGVETRSGFMVALQNDLKNGKTYSFGGHQRNRLFKNLGSNQFVEVGFLEGVDSLADGYMPIVADFNKDGRLDLIVRNCDPGLPEHHTFPVVQVFENQIEKANSSLAIRLKGQKSNIQGIGAKVTLITGTANTDMKQVREIRGNNGAIQAPVMAYFSVPKGQSVKSIVVNWPSGQESRLEGARSGQILIEEPVLQVVQR